MRAHRKSFLTRGAGVAGFVLAAVVTVSACSSDSSDPSPSGTGGGGATSTAGSPAAKLAVAYRGVTPALPTKAVAVKPGLEYWVVSCGQQVESCASPAAAGVAAAKSIGWKTRLCDGQLNPMGVSNCIRQAVAAKAAAVDVVGFDCAPIKAAVLEANKAGVKTIGGGGLDCAETGGEQGYAGTVQSIDGQSTGAYYAEIGRLQAAWVIGATKGKAKVLSVKFTDESWGADMQNGFAKELATCSGCSIAKTVELSNGDVGNGTLRTKFSTALLQTPNANAVNIPVDGWFAAGLAQAVKSSGRNDALQVIGAMGLASNMGFIKNNGGQDATAAFSVAQAQWAAVDTAARLLAGETAPKGQFASGIGIQVVDKDNNLPSGNGPYEPPVDYRAAYAKLWPAK